MTEQEHEQTAKDLIYLIGCAAREATPDRKRTEKMNLESVRTLSDSLSLNAIAFMAVEEAYEGDLPEKSFFKDWEKEKDEEVYKSLKMDLELEKLLSFMEESGIWYLPMKGAVLKKIYPQPGMRQMSDMDILFDAQYRPQVREWFLKRDYKEKEVGYEKKPFYHFELHGKLFYAGSEKIWQAYYANVKERLLPIPGSKYGYRFREEDFYIFMTVHNYKHYTNGGTGLRVLLDEYVYLKAKGAQLNWAYIQGELEKLQTAEFEQQIRKLSRELFECSGPDPMEDLTEEGHDFLEDFLNLGTYGTVEHRVNNKVNEFRQEEGGSLSAAKFKYLIRRIFPPLEALETYYPFFGRHKFLLPFGYLYRLIYRVFASRQKFINELKALREMK